MKKSAQEKMKILSLISTPMNFNGQTLFPLRIAKRMNRVHTDFLTYLVGDDRIRAEAEAMDSEIFVAPHRLKNPLGYIRYVSGLVRRQGYKIVHCHGNSCTLAIDLLAAKLGGAKVRIAHSHNSQCTHAALHHLLKPLFSCLYTHAYACGEEAGRWLFGRKKFEIIRNAIDLRAYAFDPAVRASLREEYGCGDQTVVGCVANLTETKNQSFLIDAFAAAHDRNPDMLLMLVGDGPLRESLEHQAQEKGVADSVQFLGLRSDANRLIQMMDVMALPSLFEGFPTVALEWQCAGLPVLMSENITRDCAFTKLVRYLPLDADAWSDALMDLPALDRAAASRSGVAALSAAGFDLDSAAAELENEYLHRLQN